MKQTIEIDVPAGKKAVWEDGMLKFVDDEPTMPKTWREFCNAQPVQSTETFITQLSSFATQDGYSGWRRREHDDKNLLPTREAAEAHLALMQLHQLRDYYRQGWIPDWTDDESKFEISIRRNEIRVHPIVNWASFLSFPTKKLAEEFLDNFRDLIEQAGDLI